MSDLEKIINNVLSAKNEIQEAIVICDLDPENSQYIRDELQNVLHLLNKIR